MTNLNKYLLNLVKTTQWNHVIVKLQKLENIKHIAANYKFQKYDFCSSNIEDKYVKMLESVHTLNLRYCYKITDQSVKILFSVHTLDLTWCNQITYESVKLLGSVHTLNLEYFNKITD